MDDIIIGSGPAGVSAAWALLEQGRTVTMLDVGEQLESKQDDLRLRLASTEPDEWSAEDMDAYKNPRLSEKINTIRPFGSDYIYRDPAGFLNTLSGLETIELRPSFARGGLSNGWGSSILPYRQQDIADWPKPARELDKHYAALRQFMPIAGKVDDLQSLFPMLSMQESDSFRLSPQARELLKRLENKKRSLNHNGIYFGQSRQAVQDSDCRYCGMCLYGCPYGVIFNAAETLQKLLLNPSFKYLKDHYVTRFEERKEDVVLWVKNIAEQQSVKFNAKQVFVATGVLPTSKLVMNSLNIFDKSIYMKDSQHFYLPLLHSWRIKPKPITDSLSSLVQIFVEIFGVGDSEKTAHAQLYTYNNLYAVDMEKRFGPFAGLLKPLINILSQRLIVAQGFLHSDFSAKIELRLAKNKDTHLLHVKPHPNKDTGDVVNVVKKRLTQLALSTGLLPLSPLMRYGEIGSSYHCGSTFPMADNPKDFESDFLGRPAGLKRVFIVDASVFPSIPATTITLSVMANAHRIATESTKL